MKAALAAPSWWPAAIQPNTIGFANLPTSARPFPNWNRINTRDNGGYHHYSDVRLDDFIRGLGMPRRLREVKVEEADLPRLAQNCMLDDWTYYNPRPISRPEEVLEILRAAY